LHLNVNVIGLSDTLDFLSGSVVETLNHQFKDESPYKPEALRATKSWIGYGLTHHGVDVITRLPVPVVATATNVPSP
jgi:hypothetical protein